MSPASGTRTDRSTGKFTHHIVAGRQQPQTFKPTAILAKSAALNGTLNSSISGFLET